KPRGGDLKCGFPLSGMARNMRTSAMLASIKLPRLVLALALAVPFDAAQAAGCAFEPQGEGHVVEVIDGRSFRLADGREIKLAGIEPVSTETTRAGRAAALSALIAGKDVSLHGEDDAPDRYGRQSAFVFLAGAEQPVQSLLLAEGAALVSSEIADKDCAAALLAAEAAAQKAQKG